MLPDPEPVGRGAPTLARSPRFRMSAAVTHIGHRDENQDAVHADDDARLYIVADGLGGQPGGGTASAVAVDTLCRIVRQCTTGTSEDTVQLRIDLRGSPEENLLEHAVRSAHRAVMRHRVGELAEMATTIAALYLGERMAVVAHVGDSRVYRLRAGELEPLTKDHSLVNNLLDLGTLLSPEQRQSQAHVVMRALGVPRGAEPDLRCVAVEPGDVFLLCSDGLHGVLTHAEMAELLGSAEPELAAERLVWAALAAGSQDNISAVVLRLP